MSLPFYILLIVILSMASGYGLARWELARKLRNIIGQGNEPVRFVKPIERY